MVMQADGHSRDIVDETRKSGGRNQGTEPIGKSLAKTDRTEWEEDGNEEDGGCQEESEVERGSRGRGRREWRRRRRRREALGVL